MQFTVVTLFPELIMSSFTSSIMQRAQINEKISISTVNIRDFGIGSHKQVDDKPYGGGTGMILRVDVIEKAIDSVRQGLNEKVILLTPGGKKFTQSKAETYSKLDHLILVCGRYEGFDERITEFVDEEISIGDFVLSGGEIPAMAVIESTARLLKGVIAKDDATINESFSLKNGQRLLEHPQYTRPEKYKNKSIPKVLLSGDHAKIKSWREKNSISKTKKVRKDLL